MAVDLRERREMTKGFEDGLGRAFELALTPMIMALLGHLLDRWLGLVPLFTIVFLVWGVGGAGYLAWVRYQQESAVEEANSAIPTPRRTARRYTVPAAATATATATATEAGVADV
jgi:F0F1-type ATP synthase assembly protein I